MLTHSFCCLLGALLDQACRVSSWQRVKKNVIPVGSGPSERALASKLWRSSYTSLFAVVVGISQWWRIVCQIYMYLSLEAWQNLHDKLITRRKQESSKPVKSTRAFNCVLHAVSAVIAAKVLSNMAERSQNIFEKVRTCQARSKTNVIRASGSECMQRFVSC